ncbi:MAG TPA: hypothetical protein VNW95_15045 [Mucilaginibacter sp.]|jgi:hypothetical protein|nr:hypothetical protein [Mucilaginibacter sp.]
MKEKILKIINGPIQIEPIYILESDYRKLTTEKERDEFFACIKTIAIEGTKQEKFACLTLIKMIDRAKESEDIIKKNVDMINMEDDELLISPLLALCAVISKDWAISFIKKVLFKFKPINKGYSYLYDIAIRSIVSTPFWEEAIEDINYALINFDDDYLIDFFAYFKLKKERSDYKKLLLLIESSVINKINKFTFLIDERYRNNYLGLKY